MSTSTAALTPNPTTPSYPNDVEWITAYLTIHMLSTPSRRYAYLLWIAVVFFFLLFAVLHWTGSRGGSLGAYWSKWALRRRTWRKRGKIAAARTKGDMRAQPMPMSSNAQILALTVIVLGSLALCFAGPDYIAPGSKLWQFGLNSTTNSISKRAISYDTSLFISYQPQYTIPKAWWTSGGRTGLIAFALFPLCILLALKAPPFAIFAIPFMIQLHFDKLAWLHRWVGRLIWFITALHVALWSVQLARDRRSATGDIAYTYAWQYEKFIYGWIAFGVMTLLMLLSIQPLRRSHYEAFYFLHILLAPLTIIMSALHHPPVWIWCWVALGLWVCERLWRATWWLSTNGFFGRSVRQPPSEERMHAQYNSGKKAEKADLYRPTPFPPPMAIPAASVSRQTLISPPPVTSTSAQVQPPPSAYKAPHLPAPFQVEDLQPSYPPSEHSTYPPSTFHNNSSVDFAAIAPPTVYSYVPPPGFAHAELLAGMTVRLRFITPGYLAWAPGQHFLITIPAISRFCTHPFTCASICDEQAPGDEGREMVFLIRAKNGWTRDLWDEIVAMSAKGQKYHPSEKPPVHHGATGPGWQVPNTGVLLKVLVDGPFGSAIRARWGESSTAVIVAGGSGVSFGTSVLEYLCLCMAGRDGKFLGGRAGGWGKKGFRLRRIRFVWLVREFSHIQWCASVLRRCMAMIPEPGLRVDIFVTNAKTAPGIRTQPRLAAQREPQGTSREYLAPPTPQFARQGRARSGSTSSASSVESGDESAGNEYVDLSYYTGEYQDEEAFSAGNDLGQINIVDLTNFDGDDDTVLPGEAQFSKRVKKEGKVRRRQSRKINNAMTAKIQLDARATEERRQMHRDNRASFSSTDMLLSPVSPVLSPVNDKHMSIVTSSLGHLDLGNGPYAASPSVHAIHNHVSPGPVSSGGLRSPSPVSGMKHGQASDWETQTSHGSVYAMMPSVGTGSHGEQVRLEVDPQEIRDIGIVSENAWPGRPKLERILADEVETSRGPIIVACCGPVSLNAVMRKAIALQINPARIRRGDMRGSISLVSEEFEY